MSRLVAALSMLAAAGALAAEPETPAPAKTKIGAQFTAVHEVTHVGSHLSPFRHDVLEAPDNVLNKLVLHSLDDAIAKIEPASKRIYLAVATPRPRSATFSMEAAAFEAVVAQLRGMPDRAQWDRVVVATPAYRGAGTAREALPDRLQGIGIVTQGLCQGEWAYCDTSTRPATAGLAAMTPEGEPITVSRFVAPFMSIKVSILDPKTLEVLDVQEVFEHQKLYDPKSDSMDMNQNVSKRLLATRIVELVEHATREAVMASELRGNVEVREHGVAKEAPK